MLKRSRAAERQQHNTSKTCSQKTGQTGHKTATEGEIIILNETAEMVEMSEKGISNQTEMLQLNILKIFSQMIDQTGHKTVQEEEEVAVTILQRKTEISEIAETVETIEIGATGNTLDKILFRYRKNIIRCLLITETVFFKLKLLIT